MVLDLCVSWGGGVLQAHTHPLSPLLSDDKRGAYMQTQLLSLKGRNDWS